MGGSHFIDNKFCRLQVSQTTNFIELNPKIKLQQTKILLIWEGIAVSRTQNVENIRNIVLPMSEAAYYMMKNLASLSFPGNKYI